MLWYHRYAVTGNSDEHSIEALIAAGRHVDAARAASDAGEHARAAEIYEKLWDFRGALGAAKAAGDLAKVLRYALELGDAAAIAEAMAALTATEDGARTALDVLTRLRRHAEAATLAERLGDTARAIELYTRAHQELEAARLLEAQGRDRDAGRLLERALDLASISERAAI